MFDPTSKEISQNNPLASYQRLVEITRELASTLDLDLLLNSIVQAASDLCGAEAASILLYDSANQQLYFQAATNLEEPLLRGLLVPMDSLAGWIVTNRKPIMISDVKSDQRHFEAISKSTNFETRSLLGVPLINKDKVLGVLEALNKSQGAFTQHDLEMLSALAAQAAVAIENARLFQQTDLISEFVHELRTPLASLNTAAHLLLRPEMSEEQRRNMIQTIFSETLRLTDMSSAFLDLARLESGRMQFTIEVFEIAPLVEECIAALRSKAVEKELRIETKFDEALPELVADRNKIKQVMINLLSNAIKYTPNRGKIQVYGSSDGHEISIAVEDTGRGIPAESMAHLFQKFYRVPGSEKIAQGTGLGLSICKKIVDGHGGWIDVESITGDGTTFTVHLPIKRLE